MAFSQADLAVHALTAMLIFGFFTHMACGATYSLVPFVNRSALGGVAGIVGAGGNVGAVAAGFIVKGTSTIQQALFVLGAHRHDQRRSVRWPCGSHANRKLKSVACTKKRSPPGFARQPGLTPFPTRPPETSQGTTLAGGILSLLQ